MKDITCKGEIYFDDTCYFFFKTSDYMYINETYDQCLKSNLTLTDFPTEIKRNIFRFFTFKTLKRFLKNPENRKLFLCKTNIFKEKK